MTGAAHLGRVRARRWRVLVVHRQYLVTAVATRAAGRGDKPGKQQRPAVFALHVILQWCFRRVVAGTALFDLVDGRDLAVGLFDLANRVRITMAVEAPGLAFVNAAANCPDYASMAVAAAVFVGQRFDAALVALVDDVRMAFI